MVLDVIGREIKIGMYFVLFCPFYYDYRNILLSNTKNDYLFVEDAEMIVNWAYLLCVSIWIKNVLYR